MAESKHTPGPWRSGGCVVWGGDDTPVADLASGMCNRPDLWPDTTEANARLIAKAPELLEACMAADNFNTAVIEDAEKERRTDPVRERLLAKLRAAIRDATA